MQQRQLSVGDTEEQASLFPWQSPYTMKSALSIKAGSEFDCELISVGAG
jgi:hypothetical protein